MFLDRFGQSIYQNHGIQKKMICDYFTHRTWAMTSLVTYMFENITNGDDVTKVVIKKCKKNFLKNSQQIIWQICVICQNRSNNKKVMTVLILSYNVNQWRNKWRHLTGLPIFAGHLFYFSQMSNILGNKFVKEFHPEKNC